jgi:hypothetical protein
LLPPDELSGYTETPTGEVSLTDLMISHLACSLLQIEEVNVARLRAAILTKLRKEGVNGSGMKPRQSKDDLAAWFVSNPVAKLMDEGPARLACLSDGQWIFNLLHGRKRIDPIRWLVLWSALKWSCESEASNQFLHAACGNSF